MKALTVVLAVSVAALQGGCWTSSQFVDYCLTEPTPALVRERVAPGDELQIILNDGTTAKMTVESVTTTTIEGRQGGSIDIRDIQEATCSATDYEMTWLTESTLAGMGEGAAPFLAVIIAPVALGNYIYKQGLPPVREWPDIQVCRVANRPQDYPAIFEATEDDDSEVVSLSMILREKEKRELDCTPLLLAERYCAALFTDGESFTTCTEIVVPIERDGPGGVRTLSDRNLCEAQFGLRPLRRVDHQMTSEARMHVLVDQEAAERGVDCGAFGLVPEMPLPRAAGPIHGLEFRDGQFYEIGADTPFDGELETFHDTGETAAMLSLRDGRLDGAQVYYDTNGRSAELVSYEAGVLNGLHRLYWPSGRPSFEANHRDGLRHGLVTFYTEAGTVRTHYCYQDGALVSIPPLYCPQY